MDGEMNGRTRKNGRTDRLLDGQKGWARRLLKFINNDINFINGLMKYWMHS